MSMDDLPAELVLAISGKLLDSTSRIRLNSVLPPERRLVKDHDARLSLLEFIVRSTGRLRMASAETLAFLREHNSPIADAHAGRARSSLDIALQRAETGRAPEKTLRM